MSTINTSIPYSLLELATVSAGSSPADTFKNSLDLARKAEAWGYTRFWLAEHHNMLSIASSATSVLMGHIAGGTSRIRVGSGGIMLPNHAPLIVAEQFGTLGQLYPGRIDLGLGRAPGTDQLTAHAIRPDRMQAVYNFPEEVGQIQQYFSPANRSARVRAHVAEGVEVPLYILGSSTDSAWLAAKKGLPYAFASHFAPAQLFEALSIYYANFQPSEQLQEPYSIACINVIAADTDAEAERISSSLVKMMLGVLTNKIDYMQPPAELSAELRALLQEPAFQRMLKYAFIGSKKTVAQQTADFLQETRVNELMVVSHIYDHADRLRSYRLFSEIMQEKEVLSA
ncbi:LLM class flavin-dependent oxidoreductase [Cesiribacter andamanensis]|uniref:Luciferase-like monooxygenase n=1 Tax=Cesiribacter andamanensis AMV16 TaxID=1279009 RepID=M7NY72_9BACT|nr:LLM class flavin-dependent oxidoreductase [Cesiribacter andamanensis]EMR03309.1 Alkanal monooxygenase alpha chain [Cesiribacter andamanensis AMV16]